jgi:hypothetical protein
MQVSRTYELALMLAGLVQRQIWQYVRLFTSIANEQPTGLKSYWQPAQVAMQFQRSLQPKERYLT